MTDRWIPCCEKGFIEADVIRWKEAIWERRGSKEKKSVKIGEREVVTEVLRIDKRYEWVWLLVRASTMLSVSDRPSGRRAHPLKPETRIKRAVDTVMRENPDRLLWSDESVREKLLEERSHSGHRPRQPKRPRPPRHDRRY